MQQKGGPQSHRVKKGRKYTIFYTMTKAHSGEVCVEGYLDGCRAEITLTWRMTERGLD